MNHYKTVLAAIAKEDLKKMKLLVFIWTLVFYMLIKEEDTTGVVLGILPKRS